MTNSSDIQKKILTGSLWAVVPVLAAPILAGNMLETAWHFLNGFWLGKLGSVSFAAINISSFFVWMFYAVVNIVNTGTTSMVAQLDGARRRADALGAAHQGLMGACILSLIYSLIMLIFGRTFFTMMGAEEGVIGEAVKYTNIIFLYGIPYGIMECICAVLRGYGDTKTPMKGLAAGFAVTFVLDPLFILGLGPFPRMGVAGGALAGVLGFTATLIYFGLILYRKKHKFTIRKKYFRFNGLLVAKIVKIGLPPSTNSILFSVVGIVIASMVASFGTEAMAALGIGHRIESFCFLFGIAFALTAVTIVGQNMGAENRERAQKAAWVSLSYVSVIALFLALAFYCFPTELAHIFAHDAGTVAIAENYLRIISYSQVFMAAALVLDGVFSGSGNTVIPMLITVPVTLCRIPVAILLAFRFGMGIDGIWWAITIMTAVKALLCFAWFMTGKWKRTNVAKSVPEISIA